MNSLLEKKESIFQIKDRVDAMDSVYFNHTEIKNSENSENSEINENTISIVMASSNRAKQTYFTLFSFMKADYKNIHVVIVDDSDKDPILYDKIKEFPFYIDLISIKRENKNWHNPLVNYNIGFKFVKGGKVMVQNAEVCHIGKVLNFVNEHVDDNIHYVFDVNSSASYETNEQIYQSDISNVSIYENHGLFDMWYQVKDYERNFHFLTAMTRSTFDKIGEFSYDMTMGSWYDDDDFLLKIISKKIQVIPKFHTEYGIGGIHLFHGKAPDTWDRGKESNQYMFDRKKYIHEATGEYIDVTNSRDTFDKLYQKLL